MKDWAPARFGSLYATPSRNGIMRPGSVRGKGYKMINMGELFAYPRINNPEMELVELNEDEKERFGIADGDLLFARQSLVAEGAGKCSIVLKAEKHTTFESHLIRVRLNRSIANPYYWFYFFSSKIGAGYIQSLVNQVSAAGIRGSELENLKVPTPPVSVQNKVAAILSAYDDLIENNKRRIALLEKVAEEIYREWFVRMRFPGHEKTKMVKGVPEGWEVKELGSLSRINESSVSNKTGPETIFYVDISSVSTNNVSEVPQIKFSDAPSRARRLVKHGDIIWSSVRPANRAYCLMYEPPANMIVSTGFAVISPKKNIPFTFLKYATTSEPFVEQMTVVAKGAAYPATSFDDFKKAKIITPKEKLLRRFDDLVEPMFRAAWLYNKQNQVLSQTRELLLPRLLSGKLSVENLNIEFPPNMREEIVTHAERHSRALAHA